MPNPPTTLIQYLADNDIPCPRCRYNLKGTTTNQCPECGFKLKLQLVGDEPDFQPVFTWWQFTLISNILAALLVYAPGAFFAIAINIDEFFAYIAGPSHRSINYITPPLFLATLTFTWLLIAKRKSFVIGKGTTCMIASLSIHALAMAVLAVAHFD